MRNLHALHILAACCFAILATPVVALSSYEWVDLGLVTGAGDDKGTIRLPWSGENGDGSLQTYELIGGPFWDGPSTGGRVVISENNGIITAVLLQRNSAGVWRNTPDVQVGSANPIIAPTRTVQTLAELYTAAWGPERTDGDVNENGEHEPREHITVRVEWNGTVSGGNTIEPGSWQGQLLGDNAGNYAVNLPGVVSIDGNLNGELEVAVSWNGDEDINAIAVVTGMPVQTGTNWGIEGQALGDYIGPLNFEGGGNGVNIFNVEIIALGPTKGGPGNDGKDPDPDGGGGGGDGPGGGGGGGPVQPGPDGEPGEGVVPPELPETGIECVDDFLGQLADLPAIVALMAVTTGIGSGDAEIQIPLPIPGRGTQSFTLSSDPADMTVASTQVAGMRDGIRIIFRVWFGWVALNAMFQALIRW